jgi:transcriptional regulator with XRE-family HTH domain
MTLGELFKQARGAHKLVTIAKELDCSPGYLGTVEGGKNTPSPTFCEKAAIVLDCPQIAVDRWAEEVALLQQALIDAEKALAEWKQKGE